MSASKQSARTDGTDGTVQSRVYAVPVRGTGEILLTEDHPNKPVRMCFKNPVSEPPSQNTAGWNASELPGPSKADTSVVGSPPTLFPVTRQAVNPVSQAGTGKSSETAQSRGKQ